MESILERAHREGNEIRAKVEQEARDAANVCDFKETDIIPVDDIRLDTITIPNLTELEMGRYVEMMEAAANAPKEEYGKREPGEKCKYETF